MVIAAVHHLAAAVYDDRRQRSWGSSGAVEFQLSADLFLPVHNLEQLRRGSRISLNTDFTGAGCRIRPRPTDYK
jgi:hypothetical protein